MHKRNGIQRALAVLLSVLIAVPLLGIAAFAAPEDLTYNSLTTYTDYLNTGDTWYNKYGLSNATGNYDYRSNAAYYLSEDGSTLKIELTVNDETTTEYHDRANEPLYFEYVQTFPAFGEALPTSPDGLADGTKWFDKAGMITSIKNLMGEDNEYLYIFEDADYYLSVDGTILRRSYAFSEYYTMNQDELVVDDPSVMSPFIREAGNDPNAGFTLLPKSADGLNDGDYWFDAASFAEIFSGGQYTSYYVSSNYYLSDDAQTIRMEMLGNASDFVKSQYAIAFAFLHRVGEGPEDTFTLLPKSPDGLNEGDYWYDAAGLSAHYNGSDYTNYSFFLSGDGNTLRMLSRYSVFDYSMDDYSAYIYFSFLNQVGVDPLAGFTQLPTSDEGLQDGDYWYDVAGLVSFASSTYETCTFYLSDDGQILLALHADGVRETDTANGSFLFGFLRQVGVDPDAGFEPVVYDVNEIECTGYMFLLDQYLDDSIADYNATRVGQGKEPFTPEEEAQERAELLEEFTHISLFFNPGDHRIRYTYNTASFYLEEGSDDYAYLISYIQPAENHAWDDGVVTTEPTVDAEGVKTYTCTRCDATKTEAVPRLEAPAKDVVWAGYENQIDAVTLDEGDKPVVAAHDLFVIAKGHPIKVQLRFANGSTLTFARNGVGGRAVKSIADVVYDGVACELWVVDYALNAGTYTVVAKNQIFAPIGDISNDLGYTFDVDAPTYGTAVYSASIETVDPDYGYIVFDGVTKQVITVVTGTDVQKVQLRNADKNVTLTYNTTNATVAEDTVNDTPVKVWTIERLFARGEYAFSVYTRSALGLNDSGKTLTFKVDAPSDDVVLSSVDVAVDTAAGKDVFTVVTRNTVSKVKFTDTASGATLTAPRAGTDRIGVSIAQNEDGKTMTWTITVNHHPGHTYDCQALLGNAYTSAKQITVPADEPAPLLVSVTNEVNEAQTFVTFTVVTRADVSKVRLTNRATGGTITALPGGTEKVSVAISDADNGQKTWTITIKYLTKTADAIYDCQACIGEAFQSDLMQTTVQVPA